MIKVNLHGKLGKDLGESWEFDVDSPAEAIRAIEVNTKKLRKWILSSIDKYEYMIFINRNNLFTESKEFKTLKDLKDSELYLNLNKKYNEIDIIPKIIGENDVFDSDWFKVGAGSLAVAGGVILAVAVPALAPLGIGIAIAGIGLIASGVSGMMSKPPPSIPFTAQQVNPIDGLGEAGGPTSYLFNGPINTVGEGGPVPIGYGELIIGGNNVFSKYNYLYRAFLGSYDANTLQANNFGLNQYLLNQGCYLQAQEPMKALPF
jgi:predicted phage tail protein